MFEVRCHQQKIFSNEIKDVQDGDGDETRYAVWFVGAKEDVKEFASVHMHIDKILSYCQRYSRFIE